MNRKTLQQISRIRIREANALLELGLPDGAFYLAGYAVECAFKACIAKGTQRGEFPDRKKVESSYSHDLRQLCKVAGLSDALAERLAGDTAFRNNWDRVVTWSEQDRYHTHGLESARGLLEAIGNRRNGVLSWIIKQW